MKRKILSMFVLFAMLVSIFVTDGGFMQAQTEAQENPDARRLRVQILHQATSGGPMNIVGCSRLDNEGRAFPAVLPTGGNIVLRVVDNANNPVTGATIYFTTSDTNTNGAAGICPGPNMQTSGVLAYIPLGALASSATGRNQWGIPNRIFDRHAGGVTPRSRDAAASNDPEWDPENPAHRRAYYPGAARAAKAVPVGADASISIPVPVRASLQHTGTAAPTVVGYPNRTGAGTGNNIWENTTFANYATHAGNPAATAILEGDRDIFVISAMATHPDETRYNDSHPITRSFVLAGNPRIANWRTQNFLIVSVYADSRDLYDHHMGVTVPGVEREEWIRNYRARNTPNLQGGRPWQDGDFLPRTRPDFVDYTIMEVYGPTISANFTRRGRDAAEIAAHVEIFGPDTGTNWRRWVNQSTGMRVKGGWSRGTYLYEQKTFEFYARNSYNEYCQGGNNSFLFPMFGTEHVETLSDIERGNLIHEFRRFRIRNGGSDRDFAFMRDELSNELFKQAGFEVPQNYRPGVVYMNGAYYGMVMLKTPRTENHWGRMFRGRENNFHHIGSSEAGATGCMRFTCGRTLFNGLNPATITGWTGSPTVVGLPRAQNNPAESEIFPDGPGWNANFMLVNALPAGWPTPHPTIRARTYYGMTPPNCGGSASAEEEDAGTRCSTSQRLVHSRSGGTQCEGAQGCPSGQNPPTISCYDFHNSQNSICEGGTTNNPGRYPAHTPLNTGGATRTCFRGESRCSLPSQSRTGVPEGVPAAPRFGCKAVCDWDAVKQLIYGTEAVFNDIREGTQGTVNTTNGTTTFATMHPSGTTQGGGRLNPIGLSDPARWHEFQLRVDLDSLAHYYALGIYIGNVDWPANNVEMWRYFMEDDEREAAANGTSHLPTQLTQEKWHFIAQDGEMGYSIHSLNTRGSMPNFNNLAALIKRDGELGDDPAGVGHYQANPSSFMMRALIGGAAVNNKDDVPQPALDGVPAFRAKLANALSDLMEGAYNATHSRAVASGLASLLEAELRVMTGSRPQQMEGWQKPIPTPYRRIAEVARRVSLDGHVYEPYVFPVYDAAQYVISPTAPVDTETNKSNIAGPLAAASATATRPGATQRAGNRGVAGGDTMMAEIARIDQFLANREANMRIFMARAHTNVGTGSNNQPGLGHNFPAGGTPTGGYTITASVAAENHAILDNPGAGYGILNTRPFGKIAMGSIGFNQIGARADIRTSGRTGATGTGVTPTITGRYVRSPAPDTTGDGWVVLTAVPNPGFRVNPTSWPAGSIPDPKDPNNLNRRLINATSNVTWNLSFQRDTIVGCTRPASGANSCANLCRHHWERGDLRIDGLRAEAYNSQANDWIHIRNDTGRSISMRGQYLTDNTGQSAANMLKWRMPSIIVRTRSDLYVPTSDNFTEIATGHVHHPPGIRHYHKRTQTNFNVGFGERVRINDAALNELSRVESALMAPGQTQLRDSSGNFFVYSATGGHLRAGTGFSTTMNTGVPTPVNCPYGCGQLVTACSCTPTMCTTCPGITWPPHRFTCSCIPPAVLFDTHTFANLSALHQTTATGSAMSTTMQNAVPLLTWGSGSSGRQFTVSGTTITAANLGGRAQGVGFRTSALSTNPARSYRFEVAGTITASGIAMSDHRIMLRNGTGSDNISLSPLNITTGTEGTANANQPSVIPNASGAFAFSVTLTAAQVNAIAGGVINIGYHNQPNPSSPTMTLTRLRILEIT
jgi:hypothetical protein